MTEPVGVRLCGLDVSDLPERWAALGFAVNLEEGRVVGTGTPATLGIAPPGRGIVGWTLAGIEADGEIDGLVTRAAGPPRWVTAHRVLNPNGAWSIDHVVITTPRFDALATELGRRGMELRRVAEIRGRRTGFRRLGGPIMEVVEAPDAAETAFWGVTFSMRDRAALDALAASHPHVGEVRDAVQPGRRIATVAREAGLSTRMAFIDPERELGI